MTILNEDYHQTKDGIVKRNPPSKIDVKTIPLEKLKFTIILEMKEQKYDEDDNPIDIDEGEGGFGGKFTIDGVCKGHINPENGKVNSIVFIPKFDTQSNKKFIIGEVEEIIFEFLGREMDNIEGKEFETDLERKHIG